MKIKTGDNVKILSGIDRGKSGTVLRVIPKNNKLLVKGINIVKRHVKSQKGSPQGGIIDKTLPINIARAMLICPLCGKTTRVGYLLTEKTKQRLCRKCQKTFN